MFTVYFNDGYESYQEYFDTIEEARNWLGEQTSESDDLKEVKPNQFEGTWETFDGEILKMKAEIATS
jgi:hypothetical protein